MNILVTGGSGFIGSLLVDKLISQGHTVRNLDMKQPANHEDTWRMMDITSSASDLYHVFKKERFDLVYHLAAQTLVPFSIKNPSFDAKSNIMSTLHLLEMCRIFSVGKLIFASTAATYGKPKSLPVSENDTLDPLSPYGISKAACESYIRTSGIPFTILRFANVYGEGGQGVISSFMNRARNKEPLIIEGNGQQTRDYIYVKDIVQALIECKDKGTNYTLNLSCMSQTSINELADTFLSYYPSLSVTHTDAREGDISDSVLSNHLAKRLLKWEPDYSLEEGIRDMIQRNPA